MKKIRSRMLGSLASAVLVAGLWGCSEQENIAGRYEVLSGPGCEVVIAKDQLEFELISIVEGEPAYELEFDHVTSNKLGLPFWGGVGLLAENGTISFDFELDSGTGPASNWVGMVMDIGPHPQDDRLMLITRWAAKSAASDKPEVEVNIIDQLKKAGFALYSGGLGGALCVGRLDRMTAEQHAQRVKRKEDERRQQIEALQKKYRNMPYSKFATVLGLCKSASGANLNCQAAQELRGERAEQEFQFQLQALEKLNDEDFANTLKSCEENEALVDEPLCRAAFVVGTTRAAEETPSPET